MLRINGYQHLCVVSSVKMTILHVCKTLVATKLAVEEVDDEDDGKVGKEKKGAIMLMFSIEMTIYYSLLHT